MNWVATLPLAEPATITALHVLDVAALRAPFFRSRSWPALNGTSKGKYSAWKLVGKAQGGQTLSASVS